MPFVRTAQALKTCRECCPKQSTLATGLGRRAVLRRVTEKPIPAARWVEVIDRVTGAVLWRAPEAVAIIHQDQRYSYQSLNRMAGQVAAGLAEEVAALLQAETGADPQLAAFRELAATYASLPV